MEVDEELEGTELPRWGSCSDHLTVELSIQRLYLSIDSASKQARNLVLSCVTTVCFHLSSVKEQRGSTEDSSMSESPFFSNSERAGISHPLSSLSV